MIEFGTFLAYLAALLAFVWLCVGAAVVTSFMIDVLVAAVRATSVTALNVKVSRMISDRPVRLLLALSRWRRLLFELYRDREKRVTYKLTGKDDQTVAIWRGVFIWELLPEYEVIMPRKDANDQARGEGQ